MKHSGLRVTLIGEWDDRDLALLESVLLAEAIDVTYFRLGLPSAEYSLDWTLGKFPTLHAGSVRLDSGVVDRSHRILYKVARLDGRPYVDCKAVMPAPPDRNFAEREWASAIQDAIAVLVAPAGNAVYGSHANLYWQHHKYALLQRALALELAVPRTHLGTQVSTSPRAQLVAKAIGGNPSIDVGRYFSTTALDAAMVQSLGKERQSVPFCVQDLIAVHSEVRVTAIGPTLCAVLLRTANDSSVVDIRFKEELNVSAYNVTPTTARGLRELMASAGLTYCTFDILIDGEKREWLVDITPMGSWWFIDRHSVDEPITKMVAEVMKGGVKL